MATQSLANAVFKPNRLESKAQATDSAARTIIEADAAKRQAKTMRLRLARLNAEAEKPAVVPAKAAPRKARKR